MFDFRPPRTNPVLVWLAYLVLPAIERVARKIVGVEIPEWERLERLRDRRFILTPNHPSASDPLVAFCIARRLRRSFNYLACRELFSGPYGWLIQRLGCYSIVRGAPDRQAIRTTVSLLAERDRQVVIFPEGEIYGHNDLLLPFQAGVVQIGFWALERLEKADKDLSLPVVPVVVKYLHAEDARPAIADGLGRLEAQIDLRAAAGPDDYARLRRVGESVLAAVEREYLLRPEGLLADRIERVRRTILRRVAEALGTPVPHSSFAEALHTLLAAAREYCGELATEASSYEQRLHQRRVVAAQPLYHDLWRLQNMLAISDGYVAANMTTERFVEVLNRLETEVLGRTVTHVRSRALIRVAAPLELGERLQDYRAAKRPTIAAATGELQERVESLMEHLSRLGTPLRPLPSHR